MGDFQQNTITNRQAVLDYIDANSGAGGTTPTLSEVLTQGQTTGQQTIFSDNNLTSLEVNDGIGRFSNIDGDVTARVALGSSTVQLQSSDNATSEVSQMDMLPTQTQFFTFDTTGNLYSELLLRSDYTTLTYIDNDTSIISQLSLQPIQSILIYDDLVTNGVSATFLASQNAITSTFYNVTTDVQTGLSADNSNAQIYYIENATPIENIIKVDADGYYLKDVPAHDDNAAAITAGLTAGYIFKTTGSGAITTSGVLCIVE
jgi:hypothetical protein